MSRGFKFRFASVLVLRKEEEEKVKMEMAPFVKKYNSTKNTIKDLTTNLQLFNNDKSAFFKSAKQFSYYSDAVGYYRSAIKQAEIRLKSLEKDFSVVREKLNKVVLKRKAIEKIKEKDFIKYKKQRDKKMQLEADESAVKIKIAMKT